MQAAMSAATDTTPWIKKSFFPLKKAELKMIENYYGHHQYKLHKLLLSSCKKQNYDFRHKTKVAKAALIIST